MSVVERVAGPAAEDAERPWVIASNNAHKLSEIRAILERFGVSAQSPAELGAALDVDEWGATFACNAALKALAWARHVGRVALADDSGLAVDALGGAPGVHSARYGGVGASDADNNAKLIAELAALEASGGAVDRRCCYHAVIVVACRSDEAPGWWLAGARPAATVEELGADDAVVLPWEGDLWALRSFSGQWCGEVGRVARGEGGFGYDPWFRLADGRHVAELGAAEKNAVSHRGLALARLASWLERGEHVTG